MFFSLVINVGIGVDFLMLISSKLGDPYFSFLLLESPAFKINLSG